MATSKDLIGNAGVRAGLARLAAAGRVPGSLLFTGPEGVGKKLFALEFARILLCENHGCDECRVCARIGLPEIPSSDRGEDYDRVFLSGHPDVGFVVPFKRNLRVGAIRALESDANVMPYEGRRRVFIVDHAERMNDSAANALLKTLEEPPASTNIILVTSRPDSLLPTIRSRCQVVRFSPVPSSEIAELLCGVHVRDPGDAELAARVSQGSIGRAIGLNIQEFRSLREELVSVLRSASVTGDVAAMLETAELLAEPKFKERYDDAIGVLQSLIHDILALRSGSDHLVNRDLVNDLMPIAQAAGTRPIGRWQIAAEDLLSSLNVNANKKVATDALFLSFAA